MDITDIADDSSGNKIISALVTIILAGFLWVGKTTFEHVGQVAGLRHEIVSAQQDRNLLRAQYDDIVSMLNDRTRSRFTQEDGDKLLLQVKEVEKSLGHLKNAMLRDYHALKLEIAESNSTIALATQTATLHAPSRLPPVTQFTHSGGQGMQRLEFQLASLQDALATLQRRVESSQQNAAVGSAQLHTRIARPPQRLPQR